HPTRRLRRRRAPQRKQRSNGPDLAQGRRTKGLHVAGVRSLVAVRIDSGKEAKDDEYRVCNGSSDFSF
ncbi:hypothetical protein GW17_00043560, partial [Ensete ventricosum]